MGGEQLRWSFNDLSSMTNFGFQLVTHVDDKDLILTAEGTFANLGAEQAEGLLQVALDIKQYILDLSLSGRGFGVGNASGSSGDFVNTNTFKGA